LNTPPRGLRPIWIDLLLIAIILVVLAVAIIAIV
jgi:hypothetical protein